MVGGEGEEGEVEDRYKVGEWVGEERKQEWTT